MTLASAALLCTIALPGLSTTAVAAPTRPALPLPAVAPLQTVRIEVPSALDAAPFNKARSVTVPEGWSVKVVARPKKPRLEVPTPDGRLLVSRPEYGLITRLTPNKRGYPTSSTLVRGLRKPHGMVFDGNTLYVAESNRIDRYTYKDGKVGKRTTVLSGLPDSKSKDLKGAYAHALKSLALGPDHELYISVGSTENASAYDRDKKPQRASVLKVEKGKSGYTVFARGVRNGTGLAVAPDGELWTAVNNRDNTTYPYHQDYDGNGSDDYNKKITAYVNDHPIEPLARLTQGRDLGWPYCNPNPDVDPGVKGTAFDYSDRPFVRDAQLNGNGSQLDCGALPALEQGLPAHSAPLGLAFTRTELPGIGSGALVGVHGSWNRNPPREPEVAFFSYSRGEMGGQRTIMSGFQNSKGDRWGRPVAAVQGADGNVYVTDDYANAVYRLTPPA
ncbi:gluconolaconase [Microlunatus spumicola]|uniref:Gluconolaconase n=1 Tax=Microlunatus spumicola TaxID=81499 RepID=A0ABP6WYB9_9ACTN